VVWIGYAEEEKVKRMKELVTKRGTIRFPAYIPVTTYGNKYPLDNLIRPYLPRLAQAMMVSWHYAQQIESEIPLPLLLDSGGFACLFEGAKVEKRGTVYVLNVPKSDNKSEFDTIHPREVLELQEKIADVAFTLDFLIPPDLPLRQAEARRRRTIENAIWALDNRRRADLKLFACIQAWDAKSAKQTAKEYAKAGFEGVAIGGLVPRARDTDFVHSVIDAVRTEIPDLPLHCFGLGNPEFVTHLFSMGVDSVDSSSYVKLAANGKLWSSDQAANDPSPTLRMKLALANLTYASGMASRNFTASPILRWENLS
jgi:tRNA-guanine family transglycosylase